jgi:hypothetical protein
VIEREVQVHYVAATIGNPRIFREPFMNLKLVNVKLVAVLLVAAGPAFAQGKMSGPPAGDKAAPKPTKADVQKVVAGINGDKTKIQAYCDYWKLSDQIGQAEDKKDTKTAEALGPKLDAAMDKLGADFGKVMDGLEQVDPSSPEGKEFADMMSPLDKQCK